MIWAGAQEKCLGAEKILYLHLPGGYKGYQFAKLPQQSIPQSGQLKTTGICGLRVLEARSLR